MHPFSVRLLILLYLCGSALLFPACATLPPRPDLAHEPALPPADSGSLAMLAQRFTAANGPEASGFHLLIDAREALDARLALIDSATSSTRSEASSPTTRFGSSSALQAARTTRTTRENVGSLRIMAFASGSGLEML